MTESAYNKLKALLPPVDSPYSFHNLSEAETKALEEALGDGFGVRSALGSKQLPLPQKTESGQKIESGLLKFSYFELDTSNGAATEKYEDSEHPIWYPGPEDQPAPSEVVPLSFIVRRLRLYFDNQLVRFRDHLAHEKPEYASLSRVELGNLAKYRLFEKPWYEFHALQLIEYIKMTWLDVFKPPGQAASGAPYNSQDVTAEPPSREWINFHILIISGWAGELGRLVEQYYWRFRFERDAVTGIGARKGASLGGKLKSESDKSLHAEWQQIASGIWGRRPNLTKRAVAEMIKNQLGEARTAKHIARYISRPKS
jgi:hypothetical protein